MPLNFLTAENFEFQINFNMKEIQKKYKSPKLAILQDRYFIETDRICRKEHWLLKPHLVYNHLQMCNNIIRKIPKSNNKVAKTPLGKPRNKSKDSSKLI